MTLDDDDLDVSTDADLGPALERTAADLRTAFVREPDPAVADRHVAAMVAAASAASAVGSTMVVTGPSRRRQLAVAGGVVAAALAFTGGLAAAGVLPRPLQDAVADFVRPVGIDLPHSDDDDGSGAPAV